MERSNDIALDFRNIDGPKESNGDEWWRDCQVGKQYQASKMSSTNRNSDKDIQR